MKPWRLAFVCFRLIFAAAFAGVVVAPGNVVAAPKAQIMIVGVAHFVARHDIHNSAFADSPLLPNRQAQIADVVTRLSRFHPTKVLVEDTFGDRKIPNEYRRFLRGHVALGADEIHQFGFKLGARTGNATIYPIDTFGPSIYDDDTASGKRIDAYLKANFEHVSDPEVDAFGAHDEALEAHATYLDVLRYLNTDRAIDANASWYSVFAGMGTSADRAGATYVAQWYTRNTFIFSNILSVVKPGDRIVLFIGQGHEYLLREFVRLNPNLIGVSPLRYLR